MSAFLIGSGLAIGVLIGIDIVEDSGEVRWYHYLFAAGMSWIFIGAAVVIAISEITTKKEEKK